MRTMAIVGSGPAGFYTAEAALKAFGEDVRIDIIDRLPTPYGLIRAGVAPDHQSIKAVSRRYDQVAADERVRFLGNVRVGEDVGVGELTAFYDDVVLAVGAPQDRPLGIPGDDLPGVLGSAAFVGWYNGHPDFKDLEPPLDTQAVVVVGNGNVAIDCARILAKTVDELQASDIVNHALEPLSRSEVRQVHVLGRRGPHQASFTLKEVGELGELERATPLVRIGDFPPETEDAALETGQRRVVEVLRRFAARGPDASRPVTLSLDFFRRPVAVLGHGQVEALEVMKTRVDENGRAVDTGETEIIPCGMIVAAIGYRTASIPGVPFDEQAGRFVNEAGLIAPGLWCVGWARRGPSGTIGTNRPDGFALVERIAKETLAGDKPGRAALIALLAERQVPVSDFDDWRNIDALEVARARAGAPREKIVELSELRALFEG
ncbi:FAD-dependent oxidoreductase [Sandaracinobacter sp. RS1-74]|uniref:FAD-dependent oxidoreductase n=1 Tax=Sandaracinobacteroides sayramensis TaxID=2913411 RepID=UPI001EDA3F74|nr:FAD-dependent oxidoreductase [Sandaracinobacteroides sayramensis]MCG2841597.1 FAD-dependent oxidoreductase [Sandaracinobacteroides sayramensis]